MRSNSPIKRARSMRRERRNCRSASKVFVQADGAIDLRSDTVTHPTAAMRAAMAAAEVGDDVYGEDPTVNRLEQRAAEIFEREAGMFVPTGSMGNQVAIRLHTQHGQEVICEAHSHVVDWEMATISAFSGCMPRTMVGDARSADLETNSGGDCARSFLSRANRADHAGKYPQHGRRNGDAAACAEEIWAGAKNAGLPSASGWRADFQRGHYSCRCSGTDARFRYGDVLPVKRSVRPGRLHAGGLAEVIHRARIFRKALAEACGRSACWRQQA